jgi:Tfp pilus assembly protein PilO
MILAILMLVGAVVLLLLPAPNANTKIKQIKKDTFTAQLNEKQATEAVNAMRTQVAKQTWSGGGEDVDQTALALVSQLATKHSLSVVSFRRDRTVDAGDLTQMGYTINVTGTYTDMVDFEGDLEKPTTRLAVENVQLGSADESTDNVTGTIGVEAYVLTASTASDTSATPSQPKTSGKVKPQTAPAKGGKSVKA